MNIINKIATNIKLNFNDLEILNFRLKEIKDVVLK